MTSAGSEQALAAQVALVGRMSLDELRAAWRAMLGAPPPKLRSADLLARALAHELQVKALGDIPAPLRRRAADLAQRFVSEPGFTPTPGPVLKPGSSLIREWRGERHEVIVLEEGFSYRGQRLRSLSEAACKITGTKWNGLVFFGLKDRGVAREVLR
ncbi:MAG: DUF2924 domain-containing protein [Caulobacterales bacterium]